MRATDFLDEHERALVEHVLVAIRQVRGYRDIENNVGRLGWLARLAQSYPSLWNWNVLGKRMRTDESLVRELMRLDWASSELDLPTKAAVGNAFLVAKVQLFRSLLLALEACADEQTSSLATQVQQELDQAVYTLLGEEVLLNIVQAEETDDAVKRRAARVLVGVWDRPALTEVTEFSPALEALWFARNRVEVQLGTLMGVTEFFRLAQQNVPEEFVAFFTREDRSPAEQAAFEEFLFGLLYEDIERLRAEMRARGIGCIDATFAREVLGPDAVKCIGGGDSLALFRSYRRRALACAFRRMSRAPGPRRAAEAYLMEALLARDVRQPAATRAAGA